MSREKNAKEKMVLKKLKKLNYCLINKLFAPLRILIH